jgi:tRNA-dihydrouridine synthase 3
MPSVSQISENPVAVPGSEEDPASKPALQFAPTQESLITPHEKFKSIDVTTRCPVWDELGECRYGFKCRFLGGHVKITPAGESTDVTEELTLVADEDKKAHAAVSMKEINFVGADVQKALRSRKVWDNLLSCSFLPTDF